MPRPVGSRRRPRGAERLAFVCIAVLLLIVGVASAQDPGAPQDAGGANPSAGAPDREPASDSDRTTLARMRAVFGELPAFDGIDLSVRHGVVRLSGAVAGAELRERAERLAAGFEGVVFVDNRLDLPPADAPGGEAAGATPTDTDMARAETLRRMLARFDELGQVRVDVVAGVVELRGEVASAAAHETAVELARSLEGVVYVSDRLSEADDVVERILPSVDKMVGWARSLLVALPLLAIAIVLFFVAWWLGSALARRDRLFERVTDNALVREILKRVVKTAFVLLGLFLGLEILDATALVGAVLGTAGVVGLALGFAFRDIVENYLASIILSIRQPFRSRDLVEIDGKLGIVLLMNTRETTLMTIDGNHLSLPNARVFKSDIVNFTRSPKRRFDVAVGVGTDVDLNEATRLGLGILDDMAGVVADPAPSAMVEELGDSNVTVRFFGWVDQRESDFAKVKSSAVRLIKGVMDEHGIDMPEPTYRVALTRRSARAGAGAGGGGEKPNVRSRGAASREAAALDVEPEREIEKQVDRELAEGGEGDLLAAGK